MPARKDFLRHIVNRVLANSNLPRQVIDDIRRMVGRAEDKYKFHAFGGDVRNLAEYLKSPEFNDLVSFLKNVRVEKGEEHPIEVLKKILLEAREAYRDIPEVVAAIDEKLKELEGEAAPRQSRIEALFSELKGFEEKYRVKVELEKDHNRIKISYGDKLNATVTFDEATSTYRLAYKIEDETTFETISELKSMLRRLLELVIGKRG